MNIDFKDMMSMHVGPSMKAEQDHIMDSVEKLEANWPEDVEAVNDIQVGLQERLVKNWWNLADSLIVHFSDGIYTFHNTTKKTLGYPAWWLQMIGYGNDFFKVQWVEFSEVPPPLLLSSLPDALVKTRAVASSVFSSV